MSLGFDVDFLAVISLVNQVRKSFVGAPEQFRAISDDVRGFSIILQDVEASCTQLSPEQSQEYQSVVTSCKHLLERLQTILDEYADVAEAGKAGKRTAIKRVWKRLKWEPDAIRDIRTQISVRIATLNSLNDQVTSQNIAKLVRHQEDTEREATLKWALADGYLNLKCTRNGTPRKAVFSFCPGNAGTGKTFTTAMVIESLRLANDAETLTTYMYCNYQNHTQTIEKLLCSLLRVALEEADHEGDKVLSTCKQMRSSNKTISRKDCLDLLKDLFSKFKRVNLIVDALDELSNEVRRPLIYDLFNLHRQGNVCLFVTSRNIPEIQHHFERCEMYTSLEVRSSDEDIQNFLRDNIFQLPSFVARSQKLQDEVINSITNASAGMFLLAELYLKSLVSTMSKGSLCKRLSNLATGSSSYDTLYEDSMLRIGFQGPESERVALQMLLVLTCARRPLSPEELSHALSIDEGSETFDEDMVPDMDDLVAACTGLVVLDDASNIVHLVHKSAAEYFERTRSRWFPRANEKVALICLRYLEIAETKPEETRGEEAPFYYYAKANWSYHSIEGENEAANETASGNASQTSSAIDRGSLPSHLAFTQLSIQQMTKEVADVHSTIVEACYAGHQAWVEQLLVVRNYDMSTYGKIPEAYINNDESFRDDVLLTIAAARGDYSMALMLLARGADPNICNGWGQTPLIIAATNGFEDLVSLLLDQESIRPDKMGRHLQGHSTAFLVSIDLGRQGCFKMLLEKSNRGLRDSHKRGAMWLAAAAGHLSIISELLKWPEVEINYADTEYCGSPLLAAIRGGHEKAASLLLPYTKTQSCGRCGITPVYYAIRKGYHSLLERLLEHDASAADHEIDLDLHNEWRWTLRSTYCELSDAEQKTPLINALHLRDVQAIQLLLPHANVNRGGTWRPLHVAAEWDNVEIFELLLKKENVEPDPVDGSGRTPFLLAAACGHCDIMKALIKQGGIQFDRRDAKGHAANDYIVRHFWNLEYFFLLTSILPVDVNKRNSEGYSLLHQACSLHPDFSFSANGECFVKFLEPNTGPLVAELLKWPQVDVNLPDGNGLTPLLLAVKNRQRDVVRLLLDREETDVLVQDGGGNDALLLASFQAPMSEAFYIQLHYGCKFRTQGIPSRYNVHHWQDVLDAEFGEYSESIFNMLIHDRRSNPYHRNKKGESIMFGVARTGTKDMVQTVLETTTLASDLANVYDGGKTLISLALLKNKNDDAVDLLIAHCPAVILQNTDAKGRSPLSYAVSRATGQATRSLLAAAEMDTSAADRYGLSTYCHR
ncbi:hypothetical protein TrVGV298_007250 [Trichoderma virens]|nr:hypothetical protein TrVGV298_007250 [Trichoderma virens]